jgi:ribosomal-protein-alanine N-acetyltransferase
MNISIISPSEFTEIEKIGKSVLPIYYDTTDLLQFYSKGTYLLYKITEKNSIVGFMILEKKRKNTHICSIGIKKKYQRKGLGTELIQYIKNIFPTCSISLNVHVENKQAIQCYEKNGLRKTKYLKNYYSIFTTNNDAFYMVYP